MKFPHSGDEKNETYTFSCVGKLFMAHARFLNLQDFNTTWTKFNPLYTGWTIEVSLAYSNSNCLFQNTFSYKVCSKDTKLQISLNLLISWLYICMQWHWGPNDINRHECIYLLKNDCIGFDRNHLDIYKLSTSALLVCCLSRHLKCLDYLPHWSKSKGTFWEMSNCFRIKGF